MGSQSVAGEEETTTGFGSGKGSRTGFEERNCGRKAHSICFT